MIHPRSRPAVLALVLAVAPAGARPGEQPSAHCAAQAARPSAGADAAPPPAAAPPSTAARVEVADVVLLDQDGRAVPLRDLLAGDAVVVIDFVYTTCTTVCPVLSAIMARVQDGLGERAGREVRLVSLTLDPARDTPARLAAAAARFGARAGWTWLGGAPEDVRRALVGLGAYTADFAAHPPLILVGDGRAGAWTRMNGFPSRERILARVDELVAARATTAARAGR